VRTDAGSCERTFEDKEVVLFGELKDLLASLERSRHPSGVATVLYWEMSGSPVNWKALATYRYSVQDLRFGLPDGPGIKNRA